jgi:glycosyltransferase involved in cell wall biosynthesis
MRVAIIGSRGYPSTYSGFETLVRQLAPHLRDSGHAVTVYSRDSAGGARVDSCDGIRRVRTRGCDGKSTSTLTYGLTSVLDSRHRGYDAALVLNVANGFYLPILRRASVPTAVNVDGIEWERDKWSRLGKAVFRAGARMSARYADRLIADSRAIGAYWREHFGVPSVYIPYGGDGPHDAGTGHLGQLGLRPGGYVLAVARIVPENNIDLFLDAVDRLDPAVPVVVAGSASYRSPLEDRLRRTARSRPALQWLGHVDDQSRLQQLWTHCGVYFHGHSVGGTNPSLLQAMGAGSPVLAVDTVYNREVLGGGEQVVGRDPAELAARMEAMLADPPLRHACARRGRGIVADRYRWGAVCQRYEDVLVELATARAAVATAPPGAPARPAGPVDTRPRR